MRRVTTAREQVELLSPWQRRAAPNIIVPRRVSGPLIIPSPSLDKYGWTQERLNANALSHWDNADELTRHEAGFWYPVARQWADHLTGHLGLHPHKGYGIIAASSPLRRWDGNLQDAHNFLTHYPHTPENIRKPPGPAGGQNLVRMQQVFHAADNPAAIRAALSSNKAGTIAPKISNFHDNMEDPHAPDPVTIDSWMPRGILWAHGEEPWIPDELNIPNGKGKLPTPRDIGIKALGWTGGYERMAEAIRHVARERDLDMANIPQAGIWSKLGGTPSPDDSMPPHPDGPLTYIDDPAALYQYSWAQHAQQHPSGLIIPGSRRTAGRGYVDHHWDHLVTDMTPEEIEVHQNGCVLDGRIARRITAFDWKQTPVDQLDWSDAKDHWWADLENGHQLGVWGSPDTGYSAALDLPYDPEDPDDPMPEDTDFRHPVRDENYKMIKFPTREHAMRGAEEEYKRLFPIGSSTGAHDSGVDYDSIIKNLRSPGPDDDFGDIFGGH